MKNKTKKDIVGYVAVDSGQVIIVDPCYLDEWKDGEMDDKQSHYGKACDITLTKKGAGKILVAGTGGYGVASRTYNGDGNYPVYAKRDKDGGIISLEIVFNSPEREAMVKILLRENQNLQKQNEKQNKRK